MSPSILQINYNFTGSRVEHEAANLPFAAPIAGVPGLRWKIWLMEEARHEAGGIYLFDDAATAQDWAQQVETVLNSNPTISNVNIKRFDIVEALTTITRGPIALTTSPKTFNQMASDALTTVPSITPAEAQQSIAQNPNTLVIDVRDAADIALTGTVPGAVNLSFGALTYLADNEVPMEWRDPRLAERARPIITTCIVGPLGALGGKLLHDMGFTNVSILAGGVQAWKDAGLPAEPLSH